MPGLPLEKAEEYLPFLIAGMVEFRINNELRVAAYLAQLAEESQQLTRWSENLNYSEKRLMQVWPRRFPSYDIASQYAHNPEKLANKVYGFRHDLGNTQPGDGWKFRGRMPMQATGRDMYDQLSDLVGIDLVADPDACLDKKTAFRCSAAIFAGIKKCNQLADGLVHNPGNFTVITERINGGTTGLASRLAYFKRARAILPDNLVIVGEDVVYQPAAPTSEPAVPAPAPAPEPAPVQDEPAPIEQPSTQEPPPAQGGVIQNVSEKVNVVGDKYQWLEATLGKFGIAIEDARTSIGTWIVLAVKTVFAFVLAYWGWVGSAVLIMIVVAFLYNRSRHRVDKQKAGIPRSLLEQIVDKL